MVKTIIVAMVLAAAVPEALSAQIRDSLVGTWRLVSTSASTATGGRNDDPFGSSPTGVLTYTREGRMSAMISYGGRKLLSGADRVSAPAHERAEAFATFLSAPRLPDSNSNEILLTVAPTHVCSVRR